MIHRSIGRTVRASGYGHVLALRYRWSVGRGGVRYGTPSAANKDRFTNGDLRRSTAAATFPRAIRKVIYGAVVTYCAIKLIHNATTLRRQADDVFESSDEGFLPADKDEAAGQIQRQNRCVGVAGKT